MASIVSKIDKKVGVFLKHNYVISRQGAGNGILLLFLLPLAIFVSRIKLSHWSHNDIISLSVSCGFLVHSCLNYYVMNRDTNELFSRGVLFCTSYVCSALFLMSGKWSYLIVVLVSIVIFEHLVIALMKFCPMSFTFGEAGIVSQGFILFLATCMCKEEHQNECIQISTTILRVGIILLLILFTLFIGLDLGSKPVIFYSVVVVALTIVMIPAVMYFENVNPYFWIFYLLSSQKNLLLLFYWVTCCVSAGVLISYQIKTQKKADTMMRKSFHFLTVIVFVPGLLISPCLLYLASGIAFALLVGLDIIRVLDVPPFGKVLQNGFIAFSDEKDCGKFALTPLYLLAGCSIPLWLHPRPTAPDSLLSLLSGIITVGIGDTSASLCGSLLGRNKWPRSQKTKEGSFGCFVSQLFFVIALIHYGYISRRDLITPFLAISVTSFVEAKTDQVDNLVLPLLMFIFVT